MEGLIFPILLVGIAAMLFFQMRKQRKAMSEQQKLQNSLTVGDRVMTTSGLFGTVVDTDDDSLDLEIADGVVTTWLRQAIREKVNSESDEDDSDEDSDDESSDEPADSGDEETADSTEKQKTS
ncbi:MULTISPECIES: preprotein translocase subunit YajC [Actinopolyspora]|uniref:Preprotein translocase subunit YajC n=1 Tax=Actinopolyspora saharensis TaxID=995062 RepID=A0A1H0Y3P9_9ACTN|nr:MULTISPECIES: preprotein translocase subunit YajC [Actinopolyspora]NHD17509.1 preprotein translocase subunit YajC [Actinopolyspora sp. BKK2]NHE76758.1 preprotein translocase subunit YajC [Actinopolyspora sp. BKK1]SDQ09768.1 preprotein translocase subunit YajC [Actinopolyspora saharensis]